MSKPVEGGIFLKRQSWIIIFSYILALALLCSGCGAQVQEEAAATVDPYAGMVQVESGLGTLMWAKLYDEAGLNTLDADLFYSDGTFLTYAGTDCRAKCGVDVSEHQLDIDWEAVAGAGADFAVLRAGYRGYSEGGLYEDAYFAENLTGALAAGLEVGIYFFSQAINEDEAREEAEYALELLTAAGISDPEALALPVFFDWEPIGTEPARTDDVSGETLTACALAFCEVIEAAGYGSGIYTDRYTAYYSYNLDDIAAKTLWISAAGDAPDFYYAFDFWQYSFTGSVDGIQGEVDLDLWFIPASEAAETTPPPEEAEPTAAAEAETETADSADAEPAALVEDVSVGNAVVFDG
ncbi:MAG: glycoside hydrolase family 25 protein [Oscillospiraceae bacterium]|nr:glycoside hydrolase family 25 protein [Oscillospiraceae bacterium]